MNSRKPVSKTPYLISICLMPIVAGFAFFGRLDQGLGLCGLVAAVAGFAYLKNAEIRKPYVILTLLVITLPQLLIIFFGPFPTGRLSSIVMFPIALANYWMFLIALGFVRRFVKE